MVSVPQHPDQPPTVAGDPERVYRGLWARDGGLVTIEDADGTITGVLAHVVRHSRSGLAWGYSGSGPADLARSLIIDALEHEARCSTCAGTGIWDAALGLSVDADELTEEAHEEFVGTCPDCDDGWSPLVGRIYQRLKIAVISTLPPEGDWCMSRAEVVAFVSGERARIGL